MKKHIANLISLKLNYLKRFVWTNVTGYNDKTTATFSISSSNIAITTTGTTTTYGSTTTTSGSTAMIYILRTLFDYFQQILMKLLKYKFEHTLTQKLHLTS